MTTTTLGGTPATLSGDLPAPGSTAPAYTLAGADLAEVVRSDERRTVLNIFPSVDTGVCAASVRTFNERAAGLEGVDVVCVSQDLPFALARFCGAEGIDRVVAASAFRSTFGEDFGVRLVDTAFAGLLARAVVVLDTDGTVLHSQLVPEIGQEPDYTPPSPRWTERAAVHWPVSVKAVVVHDGAVLLARNERGEWELPGGRLEEGESPRECVVREVREETGLEVVAGAALDSWVLEVLPGLHVLVLAHVCALLSDPAALRGSEEHLEVALVGIDDLDTLPLPAGYRAAIDAALGAGHDQAADAAASFGFREAGADDVPTIVALQEPAAVVALGHFFDQRTHPFPREAVTARWYEEVADDDITVYVTTSGSRITGFGARRGDQLLHLGTALDTWGSGLARLLHDALLATFPPELKHLRLRVFAENRRARRLYARLGWRETGTSTRSDFPPHPLLLDYVLDR